MTEEFALKKGIRDGRAIDRKKRLVGAETVMIDCPCKEFFSRPAFPSEEHGDVALADLADHLIDLLHFGRGSDDPLLLSSFALRGGIGDLLLHQLS